MTNSVDQYQTAPIGTLRVKEGENSNAGSVSSAEKNVPFNS